MAKQKKIKNPEAFPPPEIKPGDEPLEPEIPEFDPDAIPDEDTDETPPYEAPAPGEGP